MINKEKVQEMLDYFKKNKDSLLVKSDDFETSYDFDGIGYYEMKENSQKEIKAHSIITDCSGEDLVFIDNNGEILIDNCNEFQLEVLTLVYNSFIDSIKEIENPTPMEVEIEEEIPEKIKANITSEAKAQEILDYFKSNKDNLFVRDEKNETSYDFDGIGYYEIKENIEKGIEEHSSLTNCDGEEFVFINNKGKIMIEDCNEIQLEVLGLVYNSFVYSQLELEAENKSLTTNLETLNNKYSTNNKKSNKKPTKK